MRINVNRQDFRYTEFASLQPLHNPAPLLSLFYLSYDFFKNISNTSGGTVLCWHNRTVPSVFKDKPEYAGERSSPLLLPVCAEC